MFTLIGLLVFVGSVRGAFVPRIVNGEDADIRDYPYQVSLQIDGRHNCGGSIISTTRILTAAHCTDKYAMARISIRAGSSIREQGGQVRTISENHVHPDWANREFDNDIAVLVLSEPLVLNDQVQIVQLADDDNQSVGSYATVTGWGLNENKTLSEVLQKLDQEKVSQENYASYLGSIYNPLVQICYGDEPGKTFCSVRTLATLVIKVNFNCLYADSGGPLVQNGVQVGVVSYGHAACDGRWPAVYAKVSYFLPYILNLM